MPPLSLPCRPALQGRAACNAAAPSRDCAGMTEMRSAETPASDRHARTGRRRVPADRRLRPDGRLQLGRARRAATARSTGSACPATTARRCFARMLDPTAGHWSIRPPARSSSERRYLDGTLVLETTFTTETGTVRRHRCARFAEGPARPRPRARRPARAAAPGRGRDRGRSSSSWSLRRGPSTASCGRCSARPTTAARTFGGPNRDRRDGRRARRDRRRDDARLLHRRATAEQVGFALRWAPSRDAAPMPTAPERRRRPDRGHRRGLALLGGRARHLRRAAPRPRALQLPRPQGPHLPPDRRDRRRRRRPRCPRTPAASATGTTASPGSATRASRSRRSTSAPAPTRPRTSSRS